MLIDDLMTLFKDFNNQLIEIWCKNELIYQGSYGRMPVEYGNKEVANIEMNGKVVMTAWGLESYLGNS